MSESLKLYLALTTAFIHLQNLDDYGNGNIEHAEDDLMSTIDIVWRRILTADDHVQLDKIEKLFPKEKFYDHLSATLDKRFPNVEGNVCTEKELNLAILVKE